MFLRESILAPFAVLLLSTLCLLPPANAQWSHSPLQNTQVTNAPNHQLFPKAVSDGRGGVILAWIDSRNLTDYDVYAQRVDASGAVRWTVNGVAVVGAANNQEIIQITGDGAGGAIIAWTDDRSGVNYDVYAQRVDSSGTPRWTADGVPVCTATGHQIGPVLDEDGLGGAYIAWYDYRSGSGSDIYAQRVNASGAALWTANGVAICAATDDQDVPIIARDAGGGAVIAWTDFRSGTDDDIYAQRVAPTGLVQWTVNGIAVCNATNAQVAPAMIGDGSGGSIIAWTDGRSGTDYDVFAQRLDSLGVGSWGTNGLGVALALSTQQYPSVVGDGQGGAFIGWLDLRYDVQGDIYAQKVHQAGYVEWPINGVPVSTALHSQDAPKLVGDGAGGIVLTWTDFRSDVDNDIYAQAIDPFGNPRWAWDGVPVSTAPKTQFTPAIVSDGNGGAVIAWTDYRAVFAKIYAQRVDPRGYLGINEPVLQSVADVPDDQGGKIIVAWDRSELDVAPYAIIAKYSVWHGIDISGSTVSAAREGDGFRVRQTSSGPTYWERVGEVPAHHLSNYKFTATTPSDSVSGGVTWNRYFVSAETHDPFVFWDSEVDSGYSVDNLSPSGVAPVATAVHPGPVVVVHWKENVSDPDVGGYEVHRSLTSGFTPDGSTMIGQTADTLLVDSSPLAGAINYYRVVTVDLRGNRSVPSAEAPAVVGTTQLFAMQDKWNMVSVPMLLADYEKSSVYPTAVSNAFAFTNAYVAAAVLANGPGYWVKFDAAQDVPITGVPIESAQYPVAAGWNMVGSIGTPVDVSTITSTPPGMVTSNFFAFTNQYTAVSALEPGKGYWVKSTGAGTLNLSAAGPADPSARIRIVDDGELPPPPPGEELAGAIPAEFALDQNYPNPFNPATTIRFAVPADAAVRLTVHNALGQEVATLVNGATPAGYHEVSFDASRLPSGMYTCRISAGSYTASRKMLLVR